MISDFVWDRLRILSPYKLRRWLKSQSWFTPVVRTMFGNSVYSNSYYKDVERLEVASVEHLADWIASALHPKRMIDVGCGPGHMMAALSKRGAEVFGVDVSTAALKMVKEKGLSAQSFDLTGDASLPGIPYDLALSCEVAEHLEERFARNFVLRLTEAAPLVFLTAAEPGEAHGVGMFHHNEQKRDYWVALMKERGFNLDDSATDDAARVFAEKKVIGYLARPMIFRSSSLQ